MKKSKLRKTYPKCYMSAETKKGSIKMKLATNDNLIQSLLNYNDHIHQVAKTFLTKIDELFNNNKFQIFGNNKISFYTFKIKEYEHNHDLIAKAMKEYRDYEDVTVNISCDSDDYTSSDDYIVHISIVPKI